MARVDEAWQDRASGILKAELARRHMTYRELAERLKSMGIEDTEKNLSNKVSRGTFTAAFFLQCLEAIGARSLRLDRDD